jgi:biotin transport system ATP-binding protein
MAIPTHLLEDRNGYPSTESDPILETHQLGHRYGNEHWGIQDITLRISPGAFVVLAGANGSGKTTLLKHLNALLSPDTGWVKVAGFDVSQNPAMARRHVGMVFQDPDAQIVGETVAEDLAFGPENLGLSRAEIKIRVDAAANLLGLTNFMDRRPHELSGGEKRRLAIAGVLAMEPLVMVLDEPFANLDWPATRQVLESILKLQVAGKTVIVSTHDLEKILAHAHRLLIMEKGRIVLDGDPKTLADITEPYGVRTPCSVRMGKGLSSWLA